MRVIAAIVLLICLLPSGACADDSQAEIEYLLSSLGSSDCTFIRNGKKYGAHDAEAHLRMKYRRGKRYASTSEKFIERLASESSMSNEPYYMECDSEERVPSGDWLMQRLNEYRADRMSDDEGRDCSAATVRL